MKPGKEAPRLASPYGTTKITKAHFQCPGPCCKREKTTGDSETQKSHKRCKLLEAGAGQLIWAPWLTSQRPVAGKYHYNHDSTSSLNCLEMLICQAQILHRPSDEASKVSNGEDSAQLTVSNVMSAFWNRARNGTLACQGCESNSHRTLASQKKHLWPQTPVNHSHPRHKS